MKISVFAEIKNEVDFIGYSIMSVLPYVDEIVYTDGFSTDGTVDLIRHIKEKYDKDGKIKLFEGLDCADLREDYVRHVNDTIQRTTGDWVMHLHPDMIMLNGNNLRDELKKARFDYGMFVNVKSYCGEYQEFAGRQAGWCLAFKKTPGFEFRGFYGTPEEGFYFREFSGDNIANLCQWKINFPAYYSNIRVNHLCEMKSKERREDKMRKVLINATGLKGDELEESVKNHPRVSLDCKVKRWGNFDIVKTDKSAFGPFKEYAEEFSKFKR